MIMAYDCIIGALSIIALFVCLIILKGDDDE